MTDPRPVLFSGKGLALLPFVEAAKNGKLAKYNDSQLAVLPVLISFENKDTREAFPCVETIATLSGMSNTTVLSALSSLNGHWFTIQKKTLKNGRPKNIYRMIYSRYTDNPAPGWISLSHAIIKNGLWAIMTPSARKLYLVMKAFCLPGIYADLGWINRDRDDFNPHDRDDYFDFLPNHVLKGFGKIRPSLANLCGLEDRTYWRTKKWLLDVGMISEHEGDFHSGLALYSDIKKYAPKIIQEIECIRNRLTNL